MPKKGHITKSKGIELPDDAVIKAMTEEDTYKHLGITEADQILPKEMKQKERKEYLDEQRKL